MNGLHRNRPNDELATELVNAWDLTEVGLRALLGGSTLAGQALVRELRQRELLTLEQAHALVDFHGARDRVELPGYQLVASDVDSARAAVTALDHALGGTVATYGDDRLPAVSPSAAAAGLGAGDAPAVTTERDSRLRSIPSWAIVAIVVLLIVVVPLGAWWLYTSRPGSSASVERASQLYAGGQRDAARMAFVKIVQARPDLALPHVYLARIAREQNDPANAQSELSEAIRLEPDNGLALREMGSLMLATGNPEIARRFYTRAITVNPGDRVAQGYMGCTLLRLGNTDAARRFLDRAGPGEWSSCTPAVPAPMPPGAMPPGA